MGAVSRLREKARHYQVVGIIKKYEFVSISDIARISGLDRKVVSRIVHDNNLSVIHANRRRRPRPVGTDNPQELVFE